MKTFLSESITRILKENKDLSKITVILPTQRLCSIFISLLIKEINSPQFSPNVYSIKDFIAKLSNLSKTSKTEEYLYLYKIYLEVDSGTINFNDIDVLESPKEFRSLLGYLPESLGIPHMLLISL